MKEMKREKSALVHESTTEEILNGIQTGHNPQTMTSEEIVRVRKRLGKTQKHLAELLGISIKAVHSYEQGWRNIPGYIERQLLFLLSRQAAAKKKQSSCWTIRKCPLKRKRSCPAWEFQAGKLCWFINGTICEGRVHRSWDEKMQVCRSCSIVRDLLDEPTA